MQPVTEIHAAAQSGALRRLFEQQSARNQQLLKQTPTLGVQVRSEVLPFAIDLNAPALTNDADQALAALEKTAATIAIESLISLAKENDIDHLGGGLELIGPLLMTLGAVDYRGSVLDRARPHTSAYYPHSPLSASCARARVMRFGASWISRSVLWVPADATAPAVLVSPFRSPPPGRSVEGRAGEDAFVVAQWRRRCLWPRR